MPGNQFDAFDAVETAEFEEFALQGSCVIAHKTSVQGPDLSQEDLWIPEDHSEPCMLELSQRLATEVSRDSRIVASTDAFIWLNKRANISNTDRIVMHGDLVAYEVRRVPRETFGPLLRVDVIQIS